MEADIQQRNMGLRGLGSTAESLTNIAMRDIGTAKDDKRRAIAAAGAAISKGYENLGSAVNFMGMTKGQGGQGSSLPGGTTQAVGRAPQNDFYDYRTGQSFEKEG